MLSLPTARTQRGNAAARHRFAPSQHAFGRPVSAAGQLQRLQLCNVATAGWILPRSWRLGPTKVPTIMRTAAAWHCWKGSRSSKGAVHGGATCFTQSAQLSASCQMKMFLEKHVQELVTTCMVQHVLSPACAIQQPEATIPHPAWHMAHISCSQFMCICTTRLNGVARRP
jgi:hypothetical protein